MPLTSQQNIPNAPTFKEEWSKRALVSIRTAVETVAKVFNALEAILLFMVLITGFGELFGRKLSIGWYIILGCTLLINAALRFKAARSQTE